MMIFLLLILLITAMLLHPAVCVAGAASGLTVWLNSVMPSLFPFMVLTGLLIRLDILRQISDRMKKWPVVRHLPVTPIFAVITGLLCGYPMGIRTVGELKNTGQISERQAKVLSAFVNQPGPMFVLGYALPLCRLAPQEQHLFLASFYGGIGITAFLAVISDAAGRRFSSSGKAAVLSDHRLASSGLSERRETAMSFPPPPAAGLLSCFEETLMSSMVTMTKIGGNMMLFCLTSALAGELLPHLPGLQLLFCGLLEMTSGLSLAASLGGTAVPLYILGFIAFGGLSVAAQSFTLGNLNASGQLRYLLWKTVQVGITVGLFALLTGC